MKNIITNIAIITFAIVVPTGSMFAVMGAIASSINPPTIQQPENK